ncbi:MAG: cyclic-di-AMP receptor [Clostridia bacterium]|nr:cyclic-di-AMP receptor [Clostridia bacterium]
MKLLIAIVQDEDANRLVSELMDAGFSVTKLATTGGFLRSGNTTLLIGTDDAKVPVVTGIVEKVCKARRQMTTAPAPVGGMAGGFNPYPLEVTVGGATLFVLSVEQFVKL